MIEQTPSKSEIFNIVQAQSETLDEVSRRLVKIEQLAEKQESRNFNIIIAVLIAAVLIVATVAIQVLLSNKVDTERNNTMLKQIYDVNKKQVELDIKQSELKNNIDSLRAKNLYLK